MAKPVVCTIAASGTKTRNDMILATAKALKKAGFKQVCGYGGDDALYRRLKSICDEVIHVGEPNVGGQMQAAIKAGLKMRPSAIIYMEGDKFTFVEYVDRLARPVVEGKADAVIAQRSFRGFLRFPLAQWAQELIFNICASILLIYPADYLYGPKAFSPAIAKKAVETKETGWGTVIYPFFFARRIGKVRVPGDPQPGYSRKYKGYGFWQQVGWRAHQTKLNFKGLLLGFWDRHFR